MKFKKISFFAIIISSMFLFSFYANEKYFNIGEYYILPMIVICLGGMKLVLSAVNTKQLRVNKQSFFIIALLSLILFITFVVRLEYKKDTLISYIILISLIFIIQNIKLKKRDIDLILKSYMFSGVVIATILLIQFKMPYNGIRRFTVFFNNSEFYDVNFLAAYLYLPFMLFLLKIIEWKNKKNIFDYINILVILLAILLTGSRGTVLALVIISICILIDIKNLSIKNIMIIICSIIIISILLPQELYERFFVNTYNDGSNNKRILNWLYGLKTLEGNFFFGNGLNWTMDIIKNYFGENITVHNTFIGLIIQLGGIGFGIFSLYLYKVGIGLKKISWKLIFIFIGWGMIMFMIEAQTSIVFYFPIYIFLILIKKNYSK